MLWCGLWCDGVMVLGWNGGVCWELGVVILVW